LIIVTPRWMHLVPFVLGLAFLVLGILSLVAGRSVTGTIQLAFAAAWILPALFKGRRRPV
jgi:hypothetical protein